MADYTAYFCGAWMPFYNADEAFFASTSPCVLPVTWVDHRVIGDGKPGPVVGRLLEAWSERVRLDIVAQALRFASTEVPGS